MATSKTGSGSGNRTNGEDRVVTVTATEKRAAQLRVKVDLRRGETTPRYIRSIAGARHS